MADPSFDGNELAYVTDCIQSGWVSRGKYIDAFEARLSEEFGMPAVTCASGTSALHLALLTYEIGTGDEVLIPDVTFAATAAAVKAVGATPVLVDIGEDMQISVEEVERKITPFTAAIIPVHLYGDMANTDYLRFLAGYDIRVIEDSAETVIPRYPSGHMACFSLFANKWITTGEGGFVLTTIPEKVRLWRDHGMTHPYFHSVAGLNHRMTNLQAAVGLAQLERYDVALARRKAILKRYQEAIPGGRGKWLYIVPKKPMRCIEHRPIFSPLHTMPPYRSSEKFPNADRLYNDFVCLPTAPHLTDDDVDTIIEEYTSQ